MPLFERNKTTFDDFSKYSMPNKFRRTNKSILTDDELMLFDAIFDSWCSESGLRKENFADLHNFPDEHTFSDEELSNTLSNLKRNKLIKSRQSLYVRKSKGIREKRDVFTLTSRGGLIWSSERNPDWNKYLVHQASLVSEGARIEVSSPSERTLNEYVEAERRSLSANLSIRIQVSYESRKNYYLVPWKRFARVYVASWLEPFCLIDESDWGAVDSARKKSNSWCDVNDLTARLS